MDHPERPSASTAASLSLNYSGRGKFQLNTRVGDILLSTEPRVKDSAGYRALVLALEHICQTAESKYAVV